MPAVTTSIELSLERGERQLWSGRPRQGLVLRPTDAFMIPFSLLWAGFAFNWEWQVLGRGAPTFFALWGIPFMLAGLYVTVGRFLVDAWRRSRTSYGVTSTRIIIASGSTTKSLMLSTLSDVTLTERSDGTGTITFGPASLQQSMYAGMAWPGVPQVPAFEFVPDARTVNQLIRQAQQGILPPEEPRLH